MNAPRQWTYSVEAYNLSHASENKIHDDTVARQFGFTGGLVPGVEVFAYACHPVVERFGCAWLERGQMECRFLKPVYDGRVATIAAEETASGLEVKVESADALCASGTASLPDRPSAAPSPAGFEVHSPPAPDRRPPADQTSLAPGTWLGTTPVSVTPDYLASYRRDIRETDPLYAAEGIVHPGQILRLCNLVLRENVVLPPWVHTGSKLTNFAIAHLGDELSARARVADNYERKGHRLVDLDVLILANGRMPIARVVHTAIYQLRSVRAT